jgi:DNA-binding transcriptional LysR family regulator
MAGLTVTEPVRALGAAHPELTVEVLRTDWTNQTTVLHDGRADVGYVRMPVDLTGLQSLVLFSEPRVAMLPSAHRLAGKKMISIQDLADEHLLQHPEAVPEWQDIATELRDERRLRRGLRTIRKPLGRNATHPSRKIGARGGLAARRTSRHFTRGV